MEQFLKQLKSLISEAETIGRESYPDLKLGWEKIKRWEQRAVTTLECFSVDEANKFRKTRGEMNMLEPAKNLTRHINAKLAFLTSLKEDTNKHSDFWKKELSLEKVTPQFSRITIIEALSTLENLSHAEIDRFLLGFGLEAIGPQALGSKNSRLNAVAKYLIDNPQKKGPFGANLTFEIIESIIEINSQSETFRSYYQPPSLEEKFPKLIHSLKRDGYLVADGKLKTALPQDINLPEIENELNHLLDNFQFNVAKSHLVQSISAHTRGDWAAANAQLRTFAESLFNSIPEKLTDPANLPPSSYKRREFLANLEPPFLLPDLNEWNFTNLGGFIQGFFNRLHPEGSHPGLSDEEDSTFRLHLVILTASYYLRRLKRRI